MKALLSIIILFSVAIAGKYNFDIVNPGDIVTNRAILFYENVVPGVLYDLQRVEVLSKYRIASKNLETNDLKQIIYQKKFITNVITETKLVKEMDKKKQVKTILITGGSVTVFWFLVYGAIKILLIKK
jgi:hypothetical protein